MIDDSPNLVAIYELVSDGYVRVAEFQLTQDGTVTLTLSDSDGCPLAQGWYAEGVEKLNEVGHVTVDDGAAFMRALLQPFRMSYCRVVDESTNTPRTPTP